MHRALLIVDSIVNLALGALLVWYPGWLSSALGLPEVATTLYPTVLGGVLIGIGVALIIAARGGEGLGIDGAIAINLCGAGIVAAWLLTAPESISPRARVTLWAIAWLVIAIGALEFLHRRSERPRRNG